MCPETSQGRGHLCVAGHELRITRRCLEEDLGEDPEECEFEGLCRAHPIVHALRARRSESTGCGDTVGPACGEMTIYTLRQGEDHRGATWFDPESRVVWLVAAGPHRSGATDDAFQHFKRLREEERIYPEEADFEDLSEDRGKEFVERAEVGVPKLLSEAQEMLGQELELQIGNEPLSCVVYVVETLEERYFAVSGLIDPEEVELLKVLFAPDSAREQWRFEQSLPTREPAYERAEVCYSIVIG